MGYNRFYLNIIVRILAISVTNIILIILVIDTKRYFSMAFFAFLFVIQLILLIYYVNRTNRDLARFLLYLQEGDTSMVFIKDKIEKTFKGLRSGFDQINKEFAFIKLEKERRDVFMSHFADHLTIGIIVFDQSDKLELINQAAKKYLNIGQTDIVKSIDKFQPHLKKFLHSLTNDKPQTQVLEFNDGYNRKLKSTFIFQSSDFTISDQIFKIVSFQDINKQLDDKEVESWQRLTRILRHEISNSITPIITTATTIRRYFKKDGKNKELDEMHQGIIDDTVNCANLIEERGNGLMEFISQYRRFTKVPIPEFKTIYLDELIHKVLKLMEVELKEKQIQLNLKIQSRITMDCDKKMIEQVLINIVKNAIEAFNNQSTVRSIQIELSKSEQRILLRISDNGLGIPIEIMDDIFIPFFSTKESGSGIGLSLSRQIMKLHGGSINIDSKEDKGTQVSIWF